MEQRADRLARLMEQELSSKADDDPGSKDSYSGAMEDLSRVLSTSEKHEVDAFLEKFSMGLEDFRLSDLRRLALELGNYECHIDAALDNERPKQALAELILMEERVRDVTCFAVHARKQFSHKPFLDTKIGNKLADRHYFMMALIAFSILLFFIGGDLLRVQLPVPEENRWICPSPTISWVNGWVTLACAVLWGFGWWVVAHRTTKALFIQSAKSFDTSVMVLSALRSTAAVVYNDVACAGLQYLPLKIWAGAMILNCALVVPLLDAMQGSLRTKRLCLMIVCLAMLFGSLYERFFFDDDAWPVKKAVSLWFQSMSPHQHHIAGSQNLTIFMVKASYKVVFKQTDFVNMQTLFRLSSYSRGKLDDRETWRNLREAAVACDRIEQRERQEQKIFLDHIGRTPDASSDTNELVQSSQSMGLGSQGLGSQQLKLKKKQPKSKAKMKKTQSSLGPLLKMQSSFVPPADSFFSPPQYKTASS